MKIPPIIVNGAAGTIYLPDGYVLPLTLQECATWQPVSRFASDSDLVAQPVVLWLLAQKLHNGGNYGWKDWRRIRQQRTKARERLSAAAMIGGSTKLAWGIGSRLVVRFSDSEIDYQTGQSDNEEITNIMRRLVNPCAEWAA